MTAIRLIWLIVGLAGSIGFGLLAVRRFRWSPLERLCGAAIVSLAILYLVAGLHYLSGLPGWVGSLTGLAGIGCCVVARGEIQAIARNGRSRAAVVGFGALCGWTLLLLAMVRSFGGTVWAIDWIEHYDRVLFFAEHRPIDTMIVGIYPIPARPPLMNLVVSMFLGGAGVRFEFYQVAFLFLNLLVFIPASLLLGMLGRRPGRRGAAVVLFGLMALSPFVMENATYAWTKSLATFCVLGGVWFYLRGIARRDPCRVGLGFLALGAGILVHYSAAPFAVFIGLHYLYWLARRRGFGAVAATASLAPAALLVFTWVGWSTSTFGSASTFGSNTTAQYSAGESVGSFAQKALVNFYQTVVPGFLRMLPRDFSDGFSQPSRLGFFRDLFFSFNQSNLLFAMGSVGGAAVVILLVSRWRTLGRGVETKPFWLGFILTGSLLAIAAHPTIDLFGVAHVCSQPLIVAGFVFLAAQIGTVPAWARIAIALGCAIDFVTGVFLQFSVEHWRVQMIQPERGPSIFNLTTDMPSKWAVENALAKAALDYQFLGDHFAGLFPVFQIVVLVGAAAILFRAFKKTAIWASAPLLLCLPILIAANRSPSPLAPARETPVTLAAAMRTESAPVWLDLGFMFWNQGQVPQAALAWCESYSLDPQPGLSRYLPFTIASSYGLELHPMYDLAETVMKNPASASAHYELGNVLWERRHPARAEFEWREALRLKPDYAEAQDALRRNGITR